MSAAAAEALILTLTRTFFLAQNGSDGPNCSFPTRPCRSLSAAVSQSGPGDRILLLHSDVTGGAWLCEDGPLVIGHSLTIEAAESWRRPQVHQATPTLGCGPASVRTLMININGKPKSPKSLERERTGSGSGLVTSSGDRTLVRLVGVRLRGVLVVLGDAGLELVSSLLEHTTVKSINTSSSVQLYVNDSEMIGEWNIAPFGLVWKTRADYCVFF